MGEEAGREKPREWEEGDLSGGQIMRRERTLMGPSHWLEVGDRQ